MAGFSHRFLGKRHAYFGLHRLAVHVNPAQYRVQRILQTKKYRLRVLGGVSA